MTVYYEMNIFPTDVILDNFNSNANLWMNLQLNSNENKSYEKHYPRILM